MTWRPAPRGAQAATTWAASRAVRRPEHPGSLVTAGPQGEASEFPRPNPHAPPGVQPALTNDDAVAVVKGQSPSNAGVTITVAATAAGLDGRERGGRGRQRVGVARGSDFGSSSNGTRFYLVNCSNIFVPAPSRNTSESRDASQPTGTSCPRSQPMAV